MKNSLLLDASKFMNVLCHSAIEFKYTFTRVMNFFTFFQTTSDAEIHWCFEFPGADPQ
jgi:hypothetical protein